MTTVEALKDLYVALGGELADVQDMSTNVAVLNAISAKYSGASDAVLNPEAVANIAAVADQIGGGSGESDYSTAEVTINNTRDNSSIQAYSGFIEDDALILRKLVSYGETKLTIVLYKGEAKLEINADEITSTSGDLEEINTALYKVTGNCTITGFGFGSLSPA